MVTMAEVDRTTGIGASDSPVIVLGERYPFKSVTPVSLWLEKKGRGQPREQTVPMKVGHILEPHIRHWFSDFMGVPIKEVEPWQRHAMVPCMRASPDGIIAGNHLRTPVNVQIKSASEPDKYGWGESWSDQIPEHVKVQCQHEMEVLNVARSYVVMCDVTGLRETIVEHERDQDFLRKLVSILDKRAYEMHKKPEACRVIVAACCAFWLCVDEDTPPQPSNGHDVALLWDKAVQGKVFESSDLAIVHAILEERAKIKQHEEVLESMVTELKGLMRDSEILRIAGTDVAKWSNPRAFDEQAFRQAHPDMAKAYTLPQLDTTKLRAEQKDLYEAFLRDGLGARRLTWLKGAKEVR